MRNTLDPAPYILVGIFNPGRANAVSHIVGGFFTTVLATREAHTRLCLTIQVWNTHLFLCMNSFNLRLLLLQLDQVLSSSSFSVGLWCLKYLWSKLGNNFPFCQCLLFSVLNESSLQTAKLIEPPPFQLKKHSALQKHMFLCTELYQRERAELGKWFFWPKCQVWNKRGFFFCCCCFWFVLFGEDKSWHLKEPTSHTESRFLGVQKYKELVAQKVKWLAQGYRWGCHHYPIQVVFHPARLYHLRTW